MLELAIAVGLEVISCDTAGWAFAGATPAWARGVAVPAVRARHGHERGTGVPEVQAVRRLGAARN